MYVGMFSVTAQGVETQHVTSYSVQREKWDDKKEFLISNKT